MKLTARLFLVILFTSFFALFLLAISVKYQLLVSDFWKANLVSGGSYKSLSRIVKTYVETKTLNGGGSMNDVKVLTDLASPENVQDFVEKNLTNILDYANGKNTVLVAYIPINKIPENLAPTSVALNSEEIPVSALMSKFNIDQDLLPLSQIAYIGRTVNYFLIGILTLLTLTIFGLFVLTEKGQRFVWPGFAFLAAGMFIVVVVVIFNLSKMNVLNFLTSGSDVLYAVMGATLPGAIEDVLRLWLWVGVASIIFGIVLFFVRRPLSNQ